MADIGLTEIDDVVEWSEADESRPDVPLPSVPADLSPRGKRLLKCNAKLRGIWDESQDGFPSDSERAYSLAYHAGRCGLSVEDAAWLLSEFYRRPGKKKLRHAKLSLTLRAWQKGREEAEREEQGQAVPRERRAEASRGDGAGDAAESEETRPRQQAQEAKPADQTLGVDAFLAPPPELIWDVEGVRVQGDHGWTGGAPKSMKGFLSLEEARACATGTPFLGQFATHKSRVLYVSEEDRRSRLHRRVHAMLQDRPPAEIPGPNDLRFLVKEGVRLDTPEGVAVLRAHVAHWQPAIVFLEHFDKLHAKDPNKGSYVAPLLAELDRLHQDFGCVFRVQKHHRKEAPGQSRRKGEMLSGSIAQFGWGESSVSLALVRRGVAQVECEAKDGETAPRFLVAFKDGKLTYAGEVKANRQEESREAVLEFLEQSPGATREQVAQALKVSDRTAGTYLRGMEKDNLVVGKGDVSKRTKHYWLKGAEPQGELLGK